MRGQSYVTSTSVRVSLHPILLCNTQQLCDSVPERTNEQLTSEGNFLRNIIIIRSRQEYATNFISIHERPAADWPTYRKGNGLLHHGTCEPEGFAAINASSLPLSLDRGYVLVVRVEQL